MWTPYRGSPALILPWCQQSPGQWLPALPPGITLLLPPPHPFSSQSPWSLERPKEGLIKDAEVGSEDGGSGGGEGHQLSFNSHRSLPYLSQPFFIQQSVLQQPCRLCQGKQRNEAAEL